MGPNVRWVRFYLALYTLKSCGKHTWFSQRSCSNVGARVVVHYLLGRVGGEVGGGPGQAHTHHLVGVDQVPAVEPAALLVGEVGGVPRP